MVCIVKQICTTENYTNRLATCGHSLRVFCVSYTRRLACAIMHHINEANCTIYVFYTNKILSVCLHCNHRICNIVKAMISLTLATACVHKTELN